MVSAPLLWDEETCEMGGGISASGEVNGTPARGLGVVTLALSVTGEDGVELIGDPEALVVTTCMLCRTDDDGPSLRNILFEAGRGGSGAPPVP